MIRSLDSAILDAASLLRSSRFTTAFTGAGISVESGIPPFRGEKGLWNKYDPRTLEIGFFLNQPEESWKVIKQIFYDFFGKAAPNQAHVVLAGMEQRGMLSCIITQNIDNLHQAAGSTVVHEFHGNSMKLVCLVCMHTYVYGEISLDTLPPRCPKCEGLLKPDFVFFGEAIPQEPLAAAYDAAGKSDVFLIIGSTGEVMPANQIPPLAKQNGATIIEINPQESHYTRWITDIFLQGKAGEVMGKLGEILFSTPLHND
ncbi:MAG: NAD-dependent deacylase [Bacteroidetes bacterium]|nr:MAG: NAD-dependent deacylase [Bacteroidota bacterium]